MWGVKNIYPYLTSREFLPNLYLLRGHWASESEKTEEAIPERMSDD